MERSFVRSLEALGDVVSFIDSFADGTIPAETIPIAQLVVEEIFTNMVRHNSQGADNIVILLEREGDLLKMVITDLDSERFDIRDHKPVDLTAPLQDRKVGGLGIHLVKHMVDEIHYHYKDGESVITLIKKLEPSNV